MSVDCANAYQALAPFYRVFLSQREHFDRQIELLLTLLSSYKLAKNARILDAACGTGDVVFGLRDKGYTKIYGIDASAPMLDQSLNHAADADKRLQVCRWQDLDCYFDDHGNFDFIYILGHALPHADRNDIHVILRHIFSGLNSDGIFCFDMRPWERSTDGNLIQAERTPGEWRLTASFEADGCTYKVSEICIYDGGRQSIRYRIQRLIGPTEVFDQDINLEVSYELFDSDEAKLWLKEAGFRNIQSQRFQQWASYLVITAQK